MNNEMSPWRKRFIPHSNVCPWEKGVHIYSNDIKELGGIMDYVEKLIH